MRRAIIYVPLFCVSCVGESLDVGDTDAGVTGGTGAGGSGGTASDPPPGPPLPVWPMADDCVSMSNLDVVGTWEGAIQDFSFNTVVPLRIEILGASELGGLCGTVRWDDGPPPEPITDLERGWPDDDRLGRGGAAAFFREGTTYTMLEGGVRARQLRFTLTAAELWKEWCSLQTSHWNPRGETYRCIPQTGVTSGPPDDGCVLYGDDGSITQIDQGKCGLCESQVCTCNETGCAATVGEVYPYAKFDLTFEANRATGTVEWNMATATDVLLTRVAP